MTDLNKQIERILPLMGNQEQFLEMWYGMWDEYVAVLNKYEIPVEEVPHSANMIDFLNKLHATLDNTDEMESENV